MNKFLAQVPDPLKIADITPPTPGGKGVDEGLTILINNGFRVVFIGFGLYAMVNFVMAAYSIIGAHGEAKNMEKARKMITNSIIALLLLSLTFIFAGIIGQVVFGDWNYLLDLTATLKSIAP